jgi:hypothetical protein
MSADRERSAWFVSGPGLQPGRKDRSRIPALATAHGKAHKKVGPPEYSRRPAEFFAGCKTYMDRPFFQAQNEAELFIDVLRTNTLAGKFKLHDFVVMPDHFHVLLTIDGEYEH